MFSAPTFRFAGGTAALLCTLSLFAACSEGASGPDKPDVPDSTHMLRAVTTGPYASGDGTVRFDGRGSHSADGKALVSYRWDFGDGNTADVPAPVHAYLTEGTYTVTLVVTDSAGTASAPARTEARVVRTTQAVVINAAANISTCATGNDDATAALVDAQPGFVFVLGDNAYPNGRAEDYNNCYKPAWGRFRNRTFAVLGNHEYDTGTADGAFDYFGAKVGPRNQGWYSMDIGTWHVIVINDNNPTVSFEPGSVQAGWLAADLAAHSNQCTIALWHRPLFLSSTDTPNYIENPTRRDLWEPLYAAGVDVVLNGHQHQYERMAPMRPDGTRDDATGIRQFNVGTGGASVSYPTASTHPNSEVRAAAFGIIKLTLRPGAYDWQFIPIAGGTFTDSGTGTCH